jgi:hypothetical protein
MYCGNNKKVCVVVGGAEINDKAEFLQWKIFIN